jgi:hypothetical protein
MLKRTLLIALLLIGTASAHDPNGSWGSSSGSSVQLWANTEQVQITVTSPQGKTSTYNGYWERFSDTFLYTALGENYRASFRDYNNIVVVSSSGKTTYWSRGQAPTRQPQARQPQAVQGPDISGAYLSSSGSSVAISCSGPVLQITVVDRQGRQTNANGRWLSQDRFEYIVNGRSAYGQMNYANNCINIQGPTGTRTTWTQR